MGFFWAPRSASLTLSNLPGEYSDFFFFFQIQEGPVLIIGESAMTLQRSLAHSERAPCILCYDCGKMICGAPRCTCGSQGKLREETVSLRSPWDLGIKFRLAGLQSKCVHRVISPDHTYTLGSWTGFRQPCSPFVPGTSPTSPASPNVATGQGLFPT